MKAKKNTPKYGLIYNASIVGAAKNNLKGKVSRTLANKCALCVRYDALGEDVEGNMGMKAKAYMEGRVKLLESGQAVITPASSAAKLKKWEAKAATKGYNAETDFVEKGESKKKRKRED